MVNDDTSRRPTIEELQALALKPLIDHMAESLVKGDEHGQVLLEWLETTEGQEAVHDLLREFLDALRRATAASWLS